MKKRVLSLILTFVVLQGALLAQDLEETLQYLSGAGARGYLAPVVSGYGADINSGWATISPKATIMGLDFEFGVVAAGAFLGDNDKTFSAQGNFRFNTSQAQFLVDQSTIPALAKPFVVDELTKQEFNVKFSGPTITGSESEYLNIEFSGTNISVGGSTYKVDPAKVEVKQVTGKLADFSFLPYAAPQIKIGDFYGTKLTFRYLPEVQINEEMGKLKYWGFGLQHNPLAWIPTPISLPVDVSLGFSVQSLQIGDILKTNGSMFYVGASKSFNTMLFGVTPYASFGFESSSLEVTYKFKVQTPAQANPVEIPISFTADGENSARFTIGSQFMLFRVMRLYVDYTAAKYSTASAGLMFGF